MPLYTTWGNDPTPALTDAPNLPAAFTAYANSIDTKLVEIVGSITERDTRFGTGLPAGTIVSCPSQRIVWMSQGRQNNVQVWETIWSDTGWKIDGATYPNPDFGPTAGATVRRQGFMTTLSMLIFYQGSTTVTAATPGGTMAARTICQLSAQYCPAAEVYMLLRAGTSTFTGRLRTSGLLEVIDGHPGATSVSGELWKGLATYPTAPGY